MNLARAVAFQVGVNFLFVLGGGGLVGLQNQINFFRGGDPPALAVQLIFSFVQSWNNYFLPSLLLTKAEMKTVPIMIAQLRSADYSKFDMGKVYMFILLAILPVLVVYILLSKSIIKGVTAGSVKG